MEPTLIITIAGSVIGSSALAEVARGFFNRRVTKSQAIHSNSDAFLQWAKEARKENERDKEKIYQLIDEKMQLQIRVTQLEAENKVLKQELHDLKEDLHAKGII